MVEHEFEWEAEVRGNKLTVKGWCDHLKRPVKHSCPLQSGKNHPDGIEGYCREKMKKLLAQEIKTKQEFNNESFPKSGSDTVDPDEEVRDERPPSERE